MLLPMVDAVLVEARKTQRDLELRRPQRKLERGLQKAFRVQGAVFLGKFERRYAEDWLYESAINLTEENLGDMLGGFFSRAELETLQLFKKPIEESVIIALSLGGKAMITDLQMNILFDLANPRAVEYVAQHGALLVTRINETTRGYIYTVVNKAVDEGWSYGRTAQAITERYREFSIGKPQKHIDSRAHLIAVTETGQAYEHGNFMVVEDLMRAGLKMEKRWVTMGDDKVSDGCLNNEAAGWIPAEETFPSGHMRPLRFPGCRCDFESRVAK